MFLYYGIIYTILLYFSFCNNNSIKMIGIILLFSHLVKDLFFKNHNWPLFTDPIAISFGVILLLNGNVLQQFIGILIISAHLRQFIYQDNLYYLLL